jgi:rubrerythrin
MERDMTGMGDKLDRTDGPDEEAPVGASVWERDLWTLLTTHVREEGDLLAQYSAVARETKSEAFSYLVHLLIEDEIRHHRIFAELAASLKTQAELGGEPPIVPTMDFARVDSTAVLEATEQLMRSEQQDARDLKRLQRELSDVKDTTLWSLLVDLMQRDTQKHIAMLRFAKDHAGRRHH